MTQSEWDNGNNSEWRENSWYQIANYAIVDASIHHEASLRSRNQGGWSFAHNQNIVFVHLFSFHPKTSSFFRIHFLFLKNSLRTKPLLVQLLVQILWLYQCLYTMYWPLLELPDSSLPALLDHCICSDAVRQFSGFPWSYWITLCRHSLFLDIHLGSSAVRRSLATYFKISLIRWTTWVNFWILQLRRYPRRASGTAHYFRSRTNMKKFPSAWRP